MAMKEALLGNHPLAATTYNNIGLVLYKKGDYDDVIYMFQKALTIQEAFAWPSMQQYLEDRYN
jgi:tetratricopeptide (TPR) repeat protein